MTDVAAAPTDRKQRWWTLPVVSAAQLLVVLDGTIVNIALPSAQADLGLSDTSRQWAITAYALAFGGLLLIGGRISSAFGHRRTFILGLAGFAAASALGGLAANPGMLFGARALQGAFAALLAPAGLALLTTTFSDARERGRAFGVFAAVGAAGSAIGLVTGGLLTEYANWRWCLYVNVPIAVLALVGTAKVPTDRGVRGHLDLGGALLSTAGFVAVVYGFDQAGSHGWGSPLVLSLLGGGVLLLVSFVVLESRTPDPLLPLRVLLHHGRGGAFLVITLMFVSMFGFYLFMSYFTQTVLGYSAVEAGLTLLINALAALIGATVVAGRLASRFTPATVVLTGLTAAIAGLLILTRLTAASTNILPLYLVPALVLTGLGLGLVLPISAALATSAVRPQDIGAASATYNASQQLGAALGTALLNTVASSATAGYLIRSGQPDAATIHGYVTALTVASGILLAAALLTLPLMYIHQRKDLS